ncbi:aspartate carbamoyltransferase regulatory subunit [Candidatus Woesearchaeota archaeon]|nr:aspartate carbamoyltransferase regulatory subunit [Candidatus Woesearchaeota archaeon]
MFDIISMRDFSKEQILTILDVADDVKRAIHDKAVHGSTFRRRFKRTYGKPLEKLLEDVTAAVMFVENSTRTHYSLRTAVTRAGGYVDGFSSAEETSLKKGETWADTAAMFALYGYNLLAMRTTTEGIPRWTKEFLRQKNEQVQEQHRSLGLPYGYTVPMIINGGDGKNQHPTQCLLDLMTIREIARGEGKGLDGLDVALLNDLKYGRTNASLMSIAHHFDWTLHFAHPQRFGPPQHRLKELQRRGVEMHHHGDDFLSAMRSVFVAYHCRPQKERVGAGEDLMTIKEIGRQTQARYDLLGDKAPYLLHPLPVDAETFEEISYDLIFHPKNFTAFQAANGLYARIAGIALGLEKVKGFFSSSESEVCEEVSLQDLPITEGRQKIIHPRSGYIEHEGIVLDHIPEGRGRRLAGVLGLEHEEVPKVISDYMPSHDGKRRKDMIKIHGQYTLTLQQYQAMALIAPDISVSIIEHGKVVKKVRPQLGSTIEGLVRCGNDACVTNVKKEHVAPKHTVLDVQGTRVVNCHYCEIEETVMDVYKANRFLYIGE